MTERARRWRFRPAFWPTLFTLPMLATLIGLGTWQLQRLEWKQARIAERETRSIAPAIDLPREIADPQALEFRRVALTGRFLHAREMYLNGRTYKGQVGVHVVTPFVLSDGRGLLVDRGWVPMARKDPASRPDGQVAGIVTLEALLRSGGWTGSRTFRPDNRPEENLWFWVDPVAMAAWAGLEDPVTALYAAAGAAENPGGLPVGGQTRVTLRNDHLQYALTWYALAVALAVIYGLYHRKREG
ncbi:MAG: SURF1 family protein [Rhodospirillales bacterium]|nr:SURF1 family protein [Rhodospirillales bacterium]MDH3791751.1 SURF1 family protein [Rhodospirillales bacterium]